MLLIQIEVDFAVSLHTSGDNQCNHTQKVNIQPHIIHMYYTEG